MSKFDEIYESLIKEKRESWNKGIKVEDTGKKTSYRGMSVARLWWESWNKFYDQIEKQAQKIKEQYTDTKVKAKKDGWTFEFYITKEMNNWDEEQIRTQEGFIAKKGKNFVSQSTEGLHDEIYASSIEAYEQFKKDLSIDSVSQIIGDEDYGY